MNKGTMILWVTSAIAMMFLYWMVNVSPPPNPAEFFSNGGVEVEQVTLPPVVVPNATPSGVELALWILPGSDGLFYVFCARGCEALLQIATVDELYAGFPTNTDAHNHSLILMARLNGGVPVLLPGTSFTPTP